MSGRSLTLRLLAAGFVAMLAALALAGFALAFLFERHVERRAVAEADPQLRTLIAGSSLSETGALTVATPPGDPQFAEAYSGLYWQIQSDGIVLARSRSLWDEEISLPPDEVPDGGVHVHDVKGPRGATLLAVERSVLLTSGGVARVYRMVVTRDRAEIERARNAFSRDLTVALTLLGVVLAAASVAQIRFGLRPLNAIRDELHHVRSGAQLRLPAVFPREVIPLADEINVLLDERDIAIEQARGRAADLAHGLKTPLTALNADARKLRERGQIDIADDIEALGAMMHRNVLRELMRARIVGRRGGAPLVRIRPVAEAVAAVVAKTPAATGKAFEFDIDSDFSLSIDRADLEELLGNLIENATRHAVSTVRIRVGADRNALRLAVCDDGQGLEPDQMTRLMRRGEQQTTSSDGAGLGLSIARELVEAYGGTIWLGRSDLGGLSVEVSVPYLNRN
ncbi:MAG: HAMP domain-containing histidine kinase [Hyphomicrobiales bacterium]|nr:MAG: HAMP domain-containing histidine kinase [Hyphomicrobiales bacterium]